MPYLTVTSRHSSLPILVIALFLGGCGGGGGGGSASPGAGSAPPPAAAPPAPTPTGTVTVGAITGFGSVFVNGVRFDTDGAEVHMDGAPALESQLAVGQVVTVIGSLNDDGVSGSATRVIFEDDVEGPISGIDLAAGRLTVLGQVVLVDGATSFDDSISPPGLDSLAPGDVIEVSGFVGSDGAIHASHIELKPAGGVFEVTGTVSAHDASARTFSINDLRVDYSAATLSDFAGGMIADGDLVEAKGNTLDADGTLLALSVERKSPMPGDDQGDGGDDDRPGEIEIEGLITRYLSAQDFDVAGLPVTTDETTFFENGTAEDLGLDVKVEVEGSLQANGVLAARKVSIRRGGSARVEATVDSVDASAGTLAVLGIEIRTDMLTRLEDDSDAAAGRFALADLRSGDWVAVRGIEDPPGSDVIAASRLQREDADDEVTVQGLVDQVSAQDSVVILGVTVQVDARTEYEDSGDVPLTAAQFFDRVAIGALVKAEGQDLGGGVVLARELELETEDD